MRPNSSAAVCWLPFLRGQGQQERAAARKQQDVDVFAAPAAVSCGHGQQSRGSWDVIRVCGADTEQVGLVQAEGQVAQQQGQAHHWLVLAEHEVIGHGALLHKELQSACKPLQQQGCRSKDDGAAPAKGRKD